LDAKYKILHPQKLGVEVEGKMQHKQQYPLCHRKGEEITG